MKTIVALVDFSDVTFKVLKQTHDLAKAFGSQVILLHVVPTTPLVVDYGVVSPTMAGEPSPEMIQEDQQKLDDLRESLAKFGIHATAVQFSGSTVESIQNECERLQADLIVVGSHGHGSFYNLLIGSVTADVLKRATCPVLVVPSPDTKQTAAV